MTSVHLVRFVAVAGPLLLLAGCAAGTPAAPTPVPSVAAPETCDESLFSDNVDADLTATASPLDDAPFPLDGVQEAGLPLVCTAHLSVDYEGGQTVEFDILVTSATLDEASGTLDDVTSTQDWVRDDTAPIWRAPDDPKHFVEAMAIDEGVLVGTTEAG